MFSRKILRIAKKESKISLKGEHGTGHWRNVECIGKYLAKQTDADKKIVKLFALLHDSRRENEDYDSDHGLRASEFIRDLYNKKLLRISEKQLEQLIFACKHHNNSDSKSDDVTIQTCWDADRLDLWRLGIEPEKELLYTDTAKKDKSIGFAKKLNKK
jgi:uncharacterized protein